MTDLLEDLKKWVLEGNGRRCARIEIGDPYRAEHFKVFVYDYELRVGQYVNGVAEIDLEAVLRKDLEQVIRRASQLGLVVAGSQGGEDSVVV